MKRYVFLTSAIRNVGGGQLYISRKIEWLKSLGWYVDVYYYNDGNIVINNLKHFKDNCIPELSLSISLLQKKARERILNLICPIEYDRLIIESHLLNLCVWGEYIVSNRKGMNLCFLLSESFAEVSSPMRKFLENKLEHNLLFGIKEHSIPSLLGKTDKTLNRWLSAVGCSSNNVQDIEYKIPFFYDGKVNIISLGRLDKPYIEPMVQNLVKFVTKHNEIEFNIVFVGDAADQRVKDLVLKSFEHVSNVFTYCTGYINPIPRSLLDRMDVAISSSGSATVTKNEGILTITIDAEDLMAIGILGVTTMNNVFRVDEPKQKVEDLLEDIIINKKYKAEDIIKNSTNVLDYSKHKEIIDRYQSGDAYDVIGWPLPFKQKILKSMIALFGYRRLSRWI